MRIFCWRQRRSLLRLESGTLRCGSLDGVVDDRNWREYVCMLCYDDFLERYLCDLARISERKDSSYD